MGRRTAQDPVTYNCYGTIIVLKLNPTSYLIFHSIRKIHTVPIVYYVSICFLTVLFAIVCYIFYLLRPNVQKYRFSIYELLAF